MTTKEISAETWKIMQVHLGFSDEEMALFQNNPKTEGIISKLPELMKMKFVFEVAQSHGCGCRHKKGDRITFDGSGQLMPELSPKRICAFSISAASQLIFTAQELIYAGVNPNDMRLNRVGCYDVGVHCGGWGNIVLEFSAET